MNQGDNDMQVIKHGRAKYTVSDSRIGFLSEILKITGKHKAVRSKGGFSRSYPRYGGQVSTRDYVREYHRANANIYTATDKNGKIYGDDYMKSIDSYFIPLSDHVTVPQGDDSVEIEL